MALMAIGLYYFLKRFTGLEDILSYMKEWQILGYMILAFFSLGGSFLWTIAAGIGSSMGVMDIAVALPVGIAFNYIGDMFLFYLGKYQKKEVLPYFSKHKRKLALSVLIMRKYGIVAIFIQKYLYGIKTLVPIAMAISKFNFVKFGTYNIFASIIFVSSVMLTSYRMGDVFKEMLDSSSKMPWYLVPAILFAIIGGTWWYMEMITKKKKTN